MNIIDVLTRRYSTKNFDPTKTLSDEQLTQIKALLRMSPSSVNLQPWHFFLAQTEGAKARVAKGAGGDFAFNAAKITDAALAVVFCVKTDADADYMQKLLDKEDTDGRFSQTEFREFMRAGRQRFSDLHREIGDFDQWMEKQVYLNMGGFLLGVATLGLDAVPMEGVDFQALDEEFGLKDKGLRAIGVVSVGYRSADDFNADLPKSRLDEADILTELA